MQSWEGEVPRQVGGWGYGRVTPYRIVMPSPPFTRAMFTRTARTTHALRTRYAYTETVVRGAHCVMATHYRHALRFALGNSFKC